MTPINASPEMRHSSQMDESFFVLRHEIEQLLTRLTKPMRIRVKAWIGKLQEPTQNAMWKKQRNQHARLLLEQVRCGALDQPFTAMPPEGQLTNLPHAMAYRYMSPFDSQRGPSPDQQRSEGAAVRYSAAAVGRQKHQQPATLAAALQLLEANGTGHRRMDAAGIDQAHRQQRKLLTLRYQDDVDRHNIPRSSPPIVHAAAAAAAAAATARRRGTPPPQRLPASARGSGGGGSDGGVQAYAQRSMESVVPAIAASELRQGLEALTGTAELLEWRLYNAQDTAMEQAGQLASAKQAARHHSARVRAVTHAELDAIIARFERSGRRHQLDDASGGSALPPENASTRGRYSSQTPRTASAKTGTPWASSSHQAAPSHGRRPTSAARPSDLCCSQTTTTPYRGRSYATPVPAPSAAGLPANHPPAVGATASNSPAGETTAAAAVSRAQAEANAGVREIRGMAEMQTELQRQLSLLDMETQRLRAELGGRRLGF